ncbi:MAG: phosphatidylserine decarboxylase [Planctomycetota bacterium]
MVTVTRPQTERRGPFGDRFTRHGRGALLLSSAILAMAEAGFIAASYLGSRWLFGGLALVALLLWAFLLSFFRNPRRRIPEGDRDVVAAADGKVTSVTEVEEEDFIGAPATRISIFLSVFNVHVNRAPVGGIVERLLHRKGTFRNALDRDARETNECQEIGIRMADDTRVLVRQIAGLIARRIVCPLDEGASIDKGFDFGMIRFGSQTEVSVPARDGRPFQVRVAPGDTVRGGETILGEW